MGQYKKLTIATLISACCIIVGAGHGIAPIALFELILPFNPDKGYFPYELSADYEHSLILSAALSFIGQILLLISIRVPSKILKFITLPFLWVGFAYLVHNFSTDVVAQLSFYTGLPFLILSIILLLLLIKSGLNHNLIYNSK